MTVRLPNNVTRDPENHDIGPRRRDTGPRGGIFLNYVGEQGDIHVGTLLSSIEVLGACEVGLRCLLRSTVIY